MNKGLVLLFMLFMLLSCGNKYENGKIISVENDKKIVNQITIKNELYSKTTPVTFHNPKDIEKFKNDLKKINAEIKSNTGTITYDQIVLKARLLDYLGKTGEALQLYVDNFDNDLNDKSQVYNHNMAKLYQALGENKEALNRYGFLVEYFNKPEYLKDMSEIFKKMGNEEKAKKAIDGYNKYMRKKTNSNEGEIKEIKVGSGGTLELN